ncbi:MAG: cupin domain-containing protein [Firmicutes bacterium]|nr:cupin domain-containing protein [Bacillota bacterium]
MREYFTATPLDNPVIYTVFGWQSGDGVTDLLATLTVLNAGRIGRELFHTKGHYHRSPDGAEYITVISGVGCLEVARDADTSPETATLEPGVHVVVPPGYAHRVFNTGDATLVYISVCSAGLGHDYDSIRSLGWRIAR